MAALGVAALSSTRRSRAIPVSRPFAVRRTWAPGPSVNGAPSHVTISSAPPARAVAVGPTSRIPTAEPSIESRSPRHVPPRPFCISVVSPASGRLIGRPSSAMPTGNAIRSPLKYSVVVTSRTPVTRTRNPDVVTGAIGSVTLQTCSGLESSSIGGRFTTLDVPSSASSVSCVGTLWRPSATIARSSEAIDIGKGNSTWNDRPT